MFLFDLFSKQELGFLTAHQAEKQFLPHMALGQANLNIAYNAHLHNLVVSDNPAPIHDNHFVTDLGFIYNSAAKNSWRLKALASLYCAGPLNQAGSTIRLSRDENEFILNYDVEIGAYRAKTESGDIRITYHPDASEYTLTQSGSVITQTFNQFGLLICDERASGLQREFFFDESNRLTRILLPSGAYISFVYHNRTMTVHYCTLGQENLLASHLFADENYQQLVQTRYAVNKDDSYNIDYHYQTIGNACVLKQISQSDSTTLSFQFNARKQLINILQGDVTQPIQLKHDAPGCVMLTEPEQAEASWAMTFDPQTGLVVSHFKPFVGGLSETVFAHDNERRLVNLKHKNTNEIHT